MLKNAQEHPDAAVRLAAVKAILALDPRLAEVPKALDRALKDQADVALAALELVGRAAAEGPPWQKAVDGLDYPSLTVRVAAVHALLRASGDFRNDPTVLGKVVQVVGEALKDGPPGLRASALQAAGRVGPPAVPVLLRGFPKEADAGLRGRYVEALAAIGTPAAEDLPMLLKLGNVAKDAGLRDAIDRMVARLRVGPERLAPLLERSLKDDTELAVAVLNLLTASPTDAQRIAPKLLAAGLEHPDAAVRRAAVKAVMRLDPGLEQVPRALDRALKDQADVALAALDVVGHPGSKAPSWEKLTGGLDHPSLAVRIATAHALLRADGDFRKAPAAVDKVVQILGQALKDGPPGLRASAIEAAGQLGAHARPLLPALRALADGPDRRLASDALLAVWRSERPDARVNSNDLALLPPDSKVIIHLRMRTLLDLFLIKSGFLADIRGRAKALKVLEPFGVDAADIHTLTLGSPGFHAGRPWTESEGVLVLRGRFDKAKPGQAVDAVDFGKSFHAACVSKEVILVSTSRDLLAQAVARSSDSAKVSAALQKLVAQADSRAMFWLASSVSEDLRQFLEAIDAPLGLTGLALMGDLDRTGRIEARFLTADSAASKAWQSYLDGLVPSVASSMRGKGQVTASDNSVRVHVEIPAAELEAMVRDILGR
jgi:hypothetical protein